LQFYETHLHLSVSAIILSFALVRKPDISPDLTVNFRIHTLTVNFRIHTLGYWTKFSPSKLFCF
jgi:hypothetical protein